METSGHFIEVLKAHFARRVAGNQRYSLRAYSRDLGVSAALLSGVLNGRKGISDKSARRICKSLGLSSAQAREFIGSVTMHCSRSPAKRRAAERLQALRAGREGAKVVLRDQDLLDMTNWIHLALLELCELLACTHEVKWFADQLKISHLAVQRALRILVESKKLSRKDGRYVPAVGETTTAMDVPNPVIQRFHAEVLDRSKQSLYNDRPENREFLAVTLAFPHSELRAAKEMIRDFQDDFCERFYRSSRKQKDSVYQLCIQLFPLAAAVKD